MSAKKSTQTMKPATAAKKLGAYLPATPAEFQERDHTIDEVEALQENPPEWLVELRLQGPHPRQVVAQKLGISTSGLARAGAADVMTTAEIKALLEEHIDELSAHDAPVFHTYRGDARIDARVQSAQAMTPAIQVAINDIEKL